MDIRKKTWKLHFTTDLAEGSGHTFPHDTQKAKNYISRSYSYYEVTNVYEIGWCGYESARNIISFGWDTIVVNPTDIPKPAKSNFVKNDKID